MLSKPSLNAGLPEDVALRVSDIWKRYRSGSYQGGTLTREIQSFVASVLGKEDPNSKVALDRSFLDSHSQSVNEWFWAVKGVSFEVKKGETVVILGRNGAGKSTLLQILAQITTADRGSVSYRGRFATLLQAGVGFHDELTGRENIFLNGAILGLNRNEIQERLGDIAEFSEIPQFLDTPVKRYSSGMRGRLGFSVAAFLGAEIMILDEIFATGDRPYREKCIAKIKDLANSGTTILLVTHVMEMLRDIVDRGIYMENGVVLHDGDKETALNLYLGKSHAVPQAKKINQKHNKNKPGKVSGNSRKETVIENQSEKKAKNKIVTGSIEALRLKLLVDEIKPKCSIKRVLCDPPSLMPYVKLELENADVISSDYVSQHGLIESTNVTDRADVAIFGHKSCMKLINAAITTISQDLNTIAILARVSSGDHAYEHLSKIRRLINLDMPTREEAEAILPSSEVILALSENAWTYDIIKIGSEYEFMACWNKDKNRLSDFMPILRQQMNGHSPFGWVLLKRKASVSGVVV